MELITWERSCIFVQVKEPTGSMETNTALYDSQIVKSGTSFYWGWKRSKDETKAI